MMDAMYWNYHYFKYLFILFTLLGFHLFMLNKYNFGLGYFNEGLSITRTIADSQWNPVYNALHRNFWLWKRNDSSVVL